jgi:hypothetical protein
MSSLTPDDQALLRQARLGLEPTSDDHARIKAGVVAQFGLGVGPVTSALSASTTAGAGKSVLTGATVAKLLGAVIVVGGLAGTTVMVLRRTRPAVTSVPSYSDTAPTAALSTAPAPPGSAVPSVPWPAGPANNPPGPVVLASPVAVATTRIASPHASTTPVAGPHPGSMDDVPGMPIAAVVAPKTQPTTLASISGPATVAAETRLLRDADAALRAGDATRALALVTEHAASFPSGVLSEERDAERIAVLCALGRNAQARESAMSFLRDHARSPLAARVRASCAAL